LTFTLHKTQLQMNNSYFDVKQLTEIEIKQFIEDGFVVVRQVFPRDLAKDILSSVWAEIDLDPHNPYFQNQLYVILKKVLYQEPIPRIFTQRYIEVVNELCRQGRWECDKGVGYWFITYPDFSKSIWYPIQNSWHIDSNTEYHVLNSRKLGLLTFHLFTDISPGGGGTAVRIGSHKYSARILAKAGPEGLEQTNFSRQTVNATKHLPFVEITGQCGDVMFMHPLTVHTCSVNISNRIRVVGHKFFHLFEPLNFKRQNPVEYSPVEISIIKALSKA